MRRVGVFNSMNNCLVGLSNHLNLIVVVKVECHIWGTHCKLIKESRYGTLVILKGLKLNKGQDKSYL